MATRSSSKKTSTTKSKKSNKISKFRKFIITPKQFMAGLLVIAIVTTLGTLSFNRIQYGSFTASAAGWKTWTYFGGGTATISKDYRTGYKYLTRGSYRACMRFKANNYTTSVDWYVYGWGSQRTVNTRVGTSYVTQCTTSFYTAGANVRITAITRGDILSISSSWIQKYY